MARPKKIGLDYFPMDVRLDQKVEALESLFGNDGLVWILKFWQAAYQTHDGIVNLGEYFGEISAKNSRITVEKQSEIIAFCVKIKLIIDLGDSSYTSNGVQKRIKIVNDERQKALERHKNNFSAKNPRSIPEEWGKVKESKEKEKEDKTSPSGDDSVLLEIYAAYPRKVGRGHALKAIRGALKKIDAPVLLAKVREYAESVKGKDPQYTPHPATWFNGERWLDEVPKRVPQYGDPDYFIAATKAGKFIGA